MGISNILNDINTILFPRLCFGCNARLYRGEQVLCTVCRNQIPLTEHNYREENTVDRIFYGRARIKKAAAFLYFTENGLVQNLIHYLKYRGQEQIGAFIGNWWGSQLKSQADLVAIDYVIPVPLHRRKQRRRGYNQVALFARVLAMQLDACYSDSFLKRKSSAITQTTKNRMLRWETLKDQFYVDSPELLIGKCILLVDDVITTGATLESCSRELEGIPGAEVSIAAIAVVP